jgi:hypothetical protein
MEPYPELSDCTITAWEDYRGWRIYTTAQGLIFQEYKGNFLVASVDDGASVAGAKEGIDRLLDRKEPESPKVTIISESLRKTMLQMLAAQKEKLENTRDSLAAAGLDVVVDEANHGYLVAKQGVIRIWKGELFYYRYEKTFNPERSDTFTRCKLAMFVNKTVHALWHKTHPNEPDPLTSPDGPKRISLSDPDCFKKVAEYFLTG